MSKLKAITVCEAEIKIKIYDFDHEDYEIITTGAVKFPCLFISKAGKAIEDIVRTVAARNECEIVEILYL